MNKKKIVGIIIACVVVACAGVYLYKINTKVKTVKVTGLKTEKLSVFNQGVNAFNNGNIEEAIDLINNIDTDNLKTKDEIKSEIAIIENSAINEINENLEKENFKGATKIYNELSNADQGNINMKELSEKIKNSENLAYKKYMKKSNEAEKDGDTSSWNKYLTKAMEIQSVKGELLEARIPVMDFGLEQASTERNFKYMGISKIDATEKIKNKTVITRYYNPKLLNESTLINFYNSVIKNAVKDGTYIYVLRDIYNPEKGMTFTKDFIDENSFGKGNILGDGYLIKDNSALKCKVLKDEIVGNSLNTDKRETFSI